MRANVPKRRRPLLCLGAVLLCLVPPIALLAQKPVESDMELPLSAEQTAETIGLLPLFHRIQQLRAHPGPDSHLELLEARQQVLLEVTAASLQVDAASGQISSEIAETLELENYLRIHRDAHVDRLNLINFGVAATTGTASSALGLTTHDHAAAIIGVLGGAATAALTLAALRVSRGPHHELLVASNMLSEVFKHPSDINNVYPPVVVAFMDAIAPGDPDGLSRQDRLIHNWIAIGRIPNPSTPAGRDKINHLTSLPGQKIQQTIGDLDDRQAMLYDLQVRLNYMKQDLAILLSSVVHPPPATPLLPRP